MYLFVVVGFCLAMWPGILHHSRPWEMMEGVETCMLIAFWLLSIIGLRYPLQMLPVLFWELVWKVIWLSCFALPAWQRGQMDGAMLANVIACSVAVLIPCVVPWRYVYAHYIQKPGEPWRTPRPQAVNV
ncbi:MAG: hypothetical protein JO142_07130 [Burkholderiales bacterium]|nr:hypothetical protein [Burkholderiales bacterium]